MKHSSFEFLQYVLIRAGFLTFITIALDDMLGGFNGVHNGISLIVWVALLIEMVVFYCLGHTRRCQVPYIIITYDEYPPKSYIKSTLLVVLISLVFIAIHVLNILDMLIPSLILLIIGVILSWKYVKSKGGIKKGLNPYNERYRRYPILKYTQYVILRAGFLTFIIILLDNICSLTLIGKHNGILFGVWFAFLIGMVIYYYNARSDNGIEVPHIIMDYYDCPVWHYVFSTFIVAVISFTIISLHFSGVVGMFILSIALLVIGIILWFIYISIADFIMKWPDTN